MNSHARFTKMKAYRLQNVTTVYDRLGIAAAYI